MNVHLKTRLLVIANSARVCWFYCVIVLALVGMARPSAAINFPVNISLSPNAGTLCVGAKQTLTATVTKQADKSAVSGASVSFTGGSVDPASGNTNTNGNVTTTWTSPASAGTVTVTATVSWVADPKNNVLASSASDKATFNFIGGAITGDTEARYYCSGPSPWSPILSAATGQPSGTTYSWSVTAGATKLALVGATNQQTVSCQGTAPSDPANMFDVTVQLTYSLNGQNCTSTQKVQVRQPSALPLLKSGPATVYYPPNSKAYGFDNEFRRYEVDDQAGKPMAGAMWNEIWDTFVRGAGPPTIIDQDGKTIPVPAPTPGNGPADANGQVTDQFFYTGVSFPTPPTQTTHSVICSMRQRVWLGSATSGLGCGPMFSANITYYSDGAYGWTP